MKDQAKKVATTKEIETKLANMETKSAKIRFLYKEGFSRSEIANILNIRYQHVRNVLITPLKRDQK